jgi:hypothetical protein
LMRVQNLAKHVDEVEAHSPAPPSREDVIVDFINRLPRELRDQIVEWMKRHIHELEGEAKTN